MALVLVVEDDVAIRNLCEFALRRCNVRVITAADGVAGLHLWREQHPTCVLMDLMMPTLNGYELFRSLCAEGLDPENVVIMTAFAKASPGEFPGVRHFLTKPFDIDLLCRTVLACSGEAPFDRPQTAAAPPPN